jgi:hypothetical protein
LWICICICIWNCTVCLFAHQEWNEISVLNYWFVFQSLFWKTIGIVQWIFHIIKTMISIISDQNHESQANQIHTSRHHMCIWRCQIILPFCISRSGMVKFQWNGDANMQTCKHANSPCEHSHIQVKVSTRVKTIKIIYLANFMIYTVIDCLLLSLSFQWEWISRWSFDFLIIKRWLNTR